MYFSINIVALYKNKGRLFALFRKKVYLLPQTLEYHKKTMKKVFALLFVGSMLTFAACQSKPKTEETTTESTTAISTDTTTMATDSAVTTVDSAATVVADTVKK
ncbi:hypothetical protein GCM10028806_49590 [Spirosoma terrae]